MNERAELIEPTLPHPEAAGVQGMTGFGRAAASMAGGVDLAWEIRSVNAKGLEVRLRLPPGYDRLEPLVRQAVAKRFTRGTIHVSLTVGHGSAASTQPAVNEELLRDLAGLAQRLQEQFGAAPARADGLLALRGVLETPETEPSEELRGKVAAEAMALLEGALAELRAARREEGEALLDMLRGHVGEIEALAARIAADPSRDPATIRERLAAQVRLLLDSGIGLDEDRLAMEAALLATKSDTREELDRLRMHATSARALLQEGGAVGRRLDFIAQELNREANTLCAKSNAAAVTVAGLELKAAVDQFREQVQNLE